MTRACGIKTPELRSLFLFQAIKAITLAGSLLWQIPHSLQKLPISFQRILKSYLKHLTKAASLTRPVKAIPKNKGYARKSSSVSDTKEFVKKHYADCMYEVRLDIQSFFSSIYTHSIPWALYTKSEAKRKRDRSANLGNQLDGCMRDMNDEQTNGIIAGNDISRIISELILCDLDARISSKLKDVAFLRFVDDYFFFAKRKADIETIISTVQQELLEYELELNMSKIRTAKSPLVFDNAFVGEIKGLYKLKPVAYVERLIQLYSRENDLRILKYGLKLLETTTFEQNSWTEVEPYVMNIWTSCPSLSSIIIPIIGSNSSFLRRQFVKRAIYSILDNNITLGNEQEVIWALWGARKIEIDISQSYLLQVMKSDNWLAIILCLDIIHHHEKEKSVTIKKALNSLRERIRDEYFSDNLRGMYTEVWLLAYEAKKNKWLDTSGGSQFDCACKDTFFREMLNRGIDFYDGNASASIRDVGNIKGSIKNANEPESGEREKKEPKSMYELAASLLGYD